MKKHPMLLLALSSFSSFSSQVVSDETSSLIDYAFECSIYAAITSHSAPTAILRQSWNKTARNWLNEAYKRGGQDDDYQVLPEHILTDFEGLDKQSVFSLSITSYRGLGCERVAQ